MAKYNPAENNYNKDNNQIAIISNCNDDIENMIYNIKGKQVMLDSDLAMLYGYEVKRLNEQVRRNKERFDDEMLFRLTDEDVAELRSQFATANVNPMSRSNPYVFTEQGIYMLGTVLKGPIAAQQSKILVKTFQKMRHYLTEHQGSLITNETIRYLIKNINHIEEVMDTKASKESFEILNKKIEDLSNNFIKKNVMKEYVFLDGEQFEADEAYIEIYKQAKKNIFVIDDYVSSKTLSHLKNKHIGVNVIIFTDNKGYGAGKLREPEFHDFNHEYPSLRLIKNNNSVHDRFIVLDYKTETEKAYHCGASSKDAGNKICSIMKYRDANIVHPIIDALLKNSEYQF